MLCCVKLLFVSLLLVNFNNEIFITAKEIELHNQNELLRNLLSSVKELSKQILKQEEKLEVIGEKLSVLEKSNPNSKETSKVNKKYDEHFNCIQNYSISSTTRAVLPTSCDEAMLQNDPHGQEDIYLMSIRNSGLQPFYAYCYYTLNKRWTVIQRRKNGAVNFYRGWEDYKNGFGDLYGEYWLGLERIYQITREQNYELLIQLRDYDGRNKYITYTNFSIGSEIDKYQLSVANHRGDIFTTYNNGRKFSTYDNNNDGNIGNYAEWHLSAWWGFAYTDLNGPYMSYSNMKTKPSMIWYDYNGDFVSDTLSLTLMAIRPT